MGYLYLLLFFTVTLKLFLSREKKESFRQALIKLENELHQKDDEWTATLLLNYTSSSLDKYLGEKIFSLHSFKIISIISITLTISTIFLANINGGDLLKNSSPIIWQKQIHFSDEQVSRYENKIANRTKESIQKKKENLSIYKKSSALMHKLDNSVGVYIFSFILYLTCPFCSIFFSYLTFSIARQILREMSHAKGGFTLIAGSLLSIILTFLLGAFFVLIFFFITTPMLWMMII